MRSALFRQRFGGRFFIRSVEQLFDFILLGYLLGDSSKDCSSDPEGVPSGL
jgi:hypothetical protein